MYIYHALINALSAHMIHINLNMIFYTHVESIVLPNIKYYTKSGVSQFHNLLRCLRQHDKYNQIV